MAENTKSAPEPRLVVEGYSESEILHWMKGKVDAACSLKTALADRENMQQALAGLDAHIEVLTNRAAIDMTRE